MPVQRRTAAAPPAEMFNFGNLSGYVGGFDIPEGDYALEYTVCNRPPNPKTGKVTPGLGVMLTAHPLNGGEPIEKFLGFGSKAHLGWAPDPNTGKGIVKIPGGQGDPTRQ